MGDVAQATAAVRLACVEDRAAIVALIAAMGGHDEIGAGADPLATLGALLAAPECRVLVAQYDGDVAGVAVLQVRTSLLYDRREAWLGALAVAPDFRSQSIGAALLAAADREAAALGCAAIVLETSIGRDRAHAFYERAGFTQRAPARRFERVVAIADAELPERFLAAAARAAARIAEAVAGRGRAAAVGIGADGAPIEAADAAAERAAFAELLPLGLPIVSEEAGLVGADSIDPAQPWISLDPLDGSRNFVNGYSPYATSIGLVQNGKPIAGLVADLAGGSRWQARAGAGASRDGRTIQTRRGPLAALPSPLPGEKPLRGLPGFMRIRVSGSTAGDLCRVGDGAIAAFFALDRPVVHVHDLAAAMLVVQEAGGCVLDRAGQTPILVPDAALFLDVVAACDRETALRLVQLP
jgi:fructose-1,6-bisphosphatase/inositol monophosphatase family enzyme/GNAT superfamily N-acetyltransferase